MITALGISLVVNVIVICMFLFMRSEVTYVREHLDNTRDAYLRCCNRLDDEKGAKGQLLEIQELVASQVQGHET